MTSFFAKTAIMASAILLIGTTATANDTIADWKDTLRGKIQSSNSYPAKAIKEGLEGIVTMRLNFTKDGTVNGVEFVKKSGHDILDRRAFTTAVRLFGMPALPAGHNEISLVIPMRFALPDNG